MKNGSDHNKKTNSPIDYHPDDDLFTWDEDEYDYLWDNISLLDKLKIILFGILIVTVIGLLGLIVLDLFFNYIFEGILID